MRESRLISLSPINSNKYVVLPTVQANMPVNTVVRTRFQYRLGLIHINSTCFALCIF